MLSSTFTMEVHMEGRLLSTCSTYVEKKENRVFLYCDPQLFQHMLEFFPLCLLGNACYILSFLLICLQFFQINAQVQGQIVQITCHKVLAWIIPHNPHDSLQVNRLQIYLLHYPNQPLLLILSWALPRYVSRKQGNFSSLQCCFQTLLRM